MFKRNVTKSSSQRILKLLKHGDVERRKEAVASLKEWSAADALPHLLQLRLEDPADEVRELATVLLRQMGAMLDLAPIGADTWFQQVKESSPAFETLCDVIGERFVGYALIAGVQVSGLTIDQFNPANTLVEYRLVESTPPRILRLPDFRRELVSWMLSDVPRADAMLLPLDLGKAQQLVGVRYILLAPLHDMSVKDVILESVGRRPRAKVVVTTGQAVEEEISVDELRERLNVEVEEELESVRDVPFELDFALVDSAEAAAAEGRWEEVLKLIGHWPGPLSVLSRMMGATLEEERRGRIGRALGLLAKAYRATGRSTWAEELYRLGLQFANEGVEGASLYQALGESMLEENRYGEAIGQLRRSVSLGTSMAVAGPTLGLALYRCQRYVAAVVVLEEARQAGAEESLVLPILKRALAEIGEGVEEWRALHSDWVTMDKLENVVPWTEDDKDRRRGERDDSTVEMMAGEELSDYAEDDVQD